METRGKIATRLQEALAMANDSKDADTFGNVFSMQHYPRTLQDNPYSLDPTLGVYGAIHHALSLMGFDMEHWATTNEWRMKQDEQ